MLKLAYIPEKKKLHYVVNRLNGVTKIHFNVTTFYLIDCLMALKMLSSCMNRNIIVRILSFCVTQFMNVRNYQIIDLVVLFHKFVLTV